MRQVINMKCKMIYLDLFPQAALEKAFPSGLNPSSTGLVSKQLMPGLSVSGPGVAVPAWA